MGRLDIRGNLATQYADVLTAHAVDALDALAPLDDDRKALMSARIARRAARAADRQRIAFLDPAATIGRTAITVQQARDGDFVGSDIPSDLRRQWIQGTGPGARPDSRIERSLRNVAYALLSGADGWMFDGEDALGQLSTMSLDNQRNLKLAIHRDAVFLETARAVAVEMNRWADGFLKRPIIADVEQQLRFTTRMFRARGLHLDDRHIRRRDGRGFSASITDVVLYVVNNAAQLRRDGSSVVLYLPKIQTAEEAALWNDILSALESHLGLPTGTVKTYVLVEQLEACFQLMEIRAALGRHFVGFNTGRWDYINSVADAMHWDDDVRPSEHRCHHDDLRLHAELRGPRAPRRQHAGQARAVRVVAGRHGTEHSGRLRPPGLPPAWRARVAGAEREQREGASGKWVAHWKMVHIVRPVWETVGQDNQLGRSFPRLSYGPCGCRWPDRVRSGAAHRARGARSNQCRRAVRQCLRAGDAGGGVEAGRLLRQ